MTKKLSCGARWSSFPPHCSGGSTYRILIPTTPASKIRAIAKYKRAQYMKKMAASADATTTVVNDDKAGNNNGNQTSEGAADSTSTSLHAETKVVLQTPSIGIVVPANKMQSVSDESIQRELAGIDRNYFLIRREMNSLTSVRTDLLWLLKKSTQLETSINNDPLN